MPIVAIKAFKDNYIWTITNEKNRSFTCVDPGDAAPIIAYAKANSLKLDHILITHHHADHTDGIAELIKLYPKIKVFGPIDQRIPLINVPVRNEDIIHIDNLSFRILSTPGHTSTHISYQEHTKAWLFTGDTLFSAGCGRVFDGTIEQLYHSINLFKNMPKDTKIFCGHEYTRANLKFAATIEPNNKTILSYSQHLAENEIQCSLPSTIELERKINPFMRTDSLELIQYAEEHGINTSEPLEIFKFLREKKNMFS